MSQRLFDESFQQLPTWGLVWNDWMPENIFITKISSSSTPDIKNKIEVKFCTFSCKHWNPSPFPRWHNARSNLEIAWHFDLQTSRERMGKERSCQGLDVVEMLSNLKLKSNKSKKTTGTQYNDIQLSTGLCKIHKSSQKPKLFFHQKCRLLLFPCCCMPLGHRLSPHKLFRLPLPPPL